LNENLSILVNLTELELYDNQLVEIQGIETLVNLKVLDLSCNRIAKIQGISFQIYIFKGIFYLLKGLSTLSRLNRLFLVNNKIERIEGLENLFELELLELGENHIKKIENLEHLTNLEKLFLGKNKIRRIEGIQTLTKLRILSLPVFIFSLIIHWGRFSSGEQAYRFGRYGIAN
jgi:protein phosphatase 1 regulatory subunit 7